MVKEKLLRITNELIKFVKTLEITPLLKLHCLNLQMRAKLSFDMAQCETGMTWVKNNLDTLVNNFTRNLLSLPPCATVNHLSLPLKQLGLDITLPSMLFEQSQTGTRLTLLQSRDPTMIKLYEHTRIPAIDSLIQASQTRKQNQQRLKTDQQLQSKAKLDKLVDQNLLINSVVNNVSQKEIESWGTHLAFITPSIASFAHRGLVRCLPTRANLQRWSKSSTDTCPNCTQRETDRHILNNCPTAATEGRYTWRHNAILKEILSVIQPRLQDGSTLFADIEGYRNTSELFDSLRPDVAILYKDSVEVLELTCCHELNLEASRVLKQTKYSDLRLVDTSNKKLHVHTLEVTSLGFVASKDFIKFCNSAHLADMPHYLTRRLGEMALRCSYFIFCCRHKPWGNDVTVPCF